MLSAFSLDSRIRDVANNDAVLLDDSDSLTGGVSPLVIVAIRSASPNGKEIAPTRVSGRETALNNVAGSLPEG